MKNIIAIFLFSLYALAATEAHQLLKLPAIFKHFAEHRQEDKNMTFLRFLNIHYLHGSPKDKDYEKDMQLPFKTIDCISAVTSAYVPVNLQFNLVRPVELPRTKIKIRSDYFSGNAYFSSIWQPPKAA